MNIRKKIATYIENRIAVRELQAMSDRSLNDIGLSRSQIRNAILSR